MSLDILERVKRIKDYLGIKSNADLANLANVTRQAVNGWINDGKQPSVEAAEALFKSASIQPEFLRYGRGDMIKKNLSEEEFLEIANSYFSQFTGEEKLQKILDLQAELTYKER